MRTIAIFALLVALTAQASAVPLSDAITSAEEHRVAGRLDDAIAVMEEAVGVHPESPKAHAYLGLYLGMRAGQSSDMMKAAGYTTRAFEHLDRAVMLDPRDLHARHFRGLISVNVPEFLGKLSGGVADLEQVVSLYRAAPDQVPFDIVVSSYLLLGTGREKQGKLDAAEEAWRQVLELAPGTSAAEQAAAGIERVRAAEPVAPAETEPEPGAGDVGDTLDAAGTLMDAGRYDEAADLLRRAVEAEPTSVEAHVLLARALGELAGRGYDERIADDTDLRTNLAFEVMEVTDRAVELAPDDMELRLLRGVVAVNMPFFVGSLDKGVRDLQRVIESDAPDALRAEAQYHLGRAYRHRALSTWLGVVKDHPNTAAAENVIRAMRPPIEHLEPGSVTGPAAVVTVVLGFQDELPPQTAVWVEDAAGGYVATLYVSGFSGHARGAQVNLPVWAGTSEFAGIDAVTSASLDVGQHVMTWDLADVGGERVADGDYLLRVETTYWPSMEGELVGLPFTLDGTAGRDATTEGRLIPYVEVRTLP